MVDDLIIRHSIDPDGVGITIVFTELVGETNSKKLPQMGELVSNYGNCCD
jgi:hypothetical protein